jgi:hypothetical protein
MLMVVPIQLARWAKVGNTDRTIFYQDGSWRQWSGRNLASVRHHAERQPFLINTLAQEQQTQSASPITVVVNWAAP